MSYPLPLPHQIVDIQLASPADQVTVTLAKGIAYLLIRSGTGMSVQRSREGIAYLLTWRGTQMSVQSNRLAILNFRMRITVRRTGTINRFVIVDL